MKKTLLITFGTLLVILIVGTWVYLVMYGKPVGNSDVFTQLDTEGSQVPDIGTLDVADTLPQDLTLDTPARLRKITGRAVAGAHLGDTSIRYVEKGTGHVYETNIETGEETLVSGTTIPQTTEATFSFDGTNVAITVVKANMRETVVGTISTDSGVSGVALPLGAREVAFTQDGTGAYYLLTTTSGSSGYLYTIANETSAELFSIPLRDVRVLWGNPHYVYTTPTGTRVGYIYKIVGRTGLSYLTNGQSGLLGVRHPNGIVITSVSEDAKTIFALSANGTRVAQALPFIPEKCATHPTDALYIFCAVPTSIGVLTFPDTWYMGSTAYDDLLWAMNVSTGEATFLIDLGTESGTEIDVYGIGTDRLGIRIYLINKNDNSLWVFDRSVQ